MLTVVTNTQDAFGIWVTGLPASGKSTLTATLKEQLRARGVDVAVLESDTLRKTFTPNPCYDEEERKTFYQQVADVGALLVAQGVPVIFDATANRRAYRNRARKQITRFLDIYVDCPVPMHMAGRKTPELQTAFEPPETPDLVTKCEGESPEAAAARVVALLVEKGYIR
jgi:adenylylsulfate kinase